MAFYKLFLFIGKNHIPLWKSMKRHSNTKHSDCSVPRRTALAAFLRCLWGPCALSSSPSPLHWFLLLLSACLFSLALSLCGVYRRQQLMQDFSFFFLKAKFSNWFVSSVTNSSQNHKPPLSKSRADSRWSTLSNLSNHDRMGYFSMLTFRGWF